MQRDSQSRHMGVYSLPILEDLFQGQKYAIDLVALDNIVPS